MQLQFRSAFKIEPDKTLILQKRAIRLMNFNDGFPLNPVPLSPFFLEVDDIYKYQVSKFVFKCLSRTNPIQFHNWFILNYDKYGQRTRSNCNTDDGTYNY